MFILLVLLTLVFIALFFPTLYKQIMQVINIQKNIYMIIAIIIIIVIIFMNRMEMFRILKGKCGTKHLNMIAGPYYSSDRINGNYNYKHPKELTPMISEDQDAVTHYIY